MPVIKAIPPTVKPYLFHGVDAAWEGRAQTVGPCPFCGKEGSRFTINVETGQYACVVCREGNARGGGNAIVFMRRLWELSFQATQDYTGLLKSRRLLNAETLQAWGVCCSVLSGDWLIPGYTADGKLCQLYKYLSLAGRMKLLPTPEHGHCLHGVNLYDHAKPEVYLCEGPWDGMALWEVLRCAKRLDDGNLTYTASEAASLYATGSVLAVPGCGVFPETWLPLFAGKRVHLMYDSDHPKEVNGVEVGRAGYKGMHRVAGLLGLAEPPPVEVRYLHWGDEGYDPSLPSGVDVRDLLTAGAPTETGVSFRVNYLQHLLDKVKPIPTDWIAGRAEAAGRGGVEMDCLPCRDWGVLVTAWRKALKWPEAGTGLDKALSVMLASALSTETVGDQLWVKIMAPASAGKSVLCEALSVNRKYVLAKSTIRGFHSGFQSDREGAEDNSLVALVKNKTLVTKDGDTLLQSPNLGQILSEARDVYDRTSRTHYRNKMSRDYEGVSMTWILCGTSSLRAIDSSELGERFLDCVIVEDIDEEQEDEIGWRVANRADREMALRADGRMETRDGPDLVKAKQLTGGYVGYLRDNAHELISAVATTEEGLRACQRLGKFVAYMRARPSSRQAERAERELSYRLISQFVRLAKGLAVVTQRPSLDAAVMQRVTAVALDTARGITLEIARWLYQAGDAGAELGVLAHQTGEPEDSQRKMLTFLRKIGVVEAFASLERPNVRPKRRWRLTARLRKLWKEVVENGQFG